MTTARQILNEHITEEQFMNQVIELAERSGYLVSHIPDGLYRLAAKQKRFNAMVGAKGFPDIVAAHATDHSRPLLFLELKAQNGRLSEEQRAWLAALKGFDYSDEVVVRVFKPSDWDEIERLLTKGIAS